MPRLKLRLRRPRPRLRLGHGVSIGTRSISWSPTRMFGVSVARRPRRRPR